MSTTAERAALLDDVSISLLSTDTALAIVGALAAGIPPEDVLARCGEMGTPTRLGAEAFIRRERERDRRAGEGPCPFGS